MTQTGTEGTGGTFLELTPEPFDRQLDITLRTAFHLTQAVLPGMVERRYGRIVMVSSVTGPLVTAAGSAAYASATRPSGARARRTRSLRPWRSSAPRSRAT